jgi:hypothetical protein
VQPLLLWKSCTYTSSKCVSVVLAIQHAMHMRLIILSYVACCTLQYFFTLSHKGQEFRKKNVIAYIYVCLSLQFM